MSRHQGTARWLAGGATLGILVVLTVALSGLVGAHGGVGTASANAATASTTGSVAPIISSDYGIFAGAGSTAANNATGAQATSASAEGYNGVASVLTPSTTNDDPIGQDYAAAQEVTVGGVHVWAIPGSSGLCVAIPSPNLPQGAAREACEPLSAMRDGDVYGLAQGPTNGMVTVFGIAPDSAGATVSIEGNKIGVQNNIFAAVLPAADFGQLFS